jgi:hypothetical protein
VLTTGRQVVERIQKNLGIPWNNKTYRDTFKAGNPDGEVHGIASTFMSNLEVLQRAHAAGRNLVITHEPTFWSDEDNQKVVADDPLYKLKVEFVEKNNMIIWRFHAHWHAQQIPGYRRKRTSSIQRLQSSNYKRRAVSLRTPRRQRSAKGCTKLDSFRAFPGGLRAAAEIVRLCR